MSLCLCVCGCIHIYLYVYVCICLWTNIIKYYFNHYKTTTNIYYIRAFSHTDTYFWTHSFKITFSVCILFNTYKMLEFMSVCVSIGYFKDSFSLPLSFSLASLSYILYFNTELYCMCRHSIYGCVVCMLRMLCLSIVVCWNAVLLWLAEENKTKEK